MWLSNVEDLEIGEQLEIVVTGNGSTDIGLAGERFDLWGGKADAIFLVEIKGIIRLEHQNSKEED